MARHLAAALAAALLTMAASGPVSAGENGKDRYIGYYYPAPDAVEVYKARTPALPEASRRRRIAFVVSIVTEMMGRPYPAPMSMFAKGDEADKLIIVSNTAGRLDTIYRVRALLAEMTSSARITPIFQELHVEDKFTFLDMAKLLGFRSVTVSDGDAFAHQILLE